MKNRDDVNDFKYDFNPTEEGSFSFEHKVEPKALSGKKAKKFNDKNTVIITVNGIEYKADTVAIAYMSSVLAIANANFNLGLATGMTASDLKSIIYDKEIPWADRLGNITNIKISDIPNAIETAMHKISTIVVK